MRTLDLCPFKWIVLPDTFTVCQEDKAEVEPGFGFEQSQPLSQPPGPGIPDDAHEFVAARTSVSRTLRPNCATLSLMTFRVLAGIGFVNGSCMDVPFNVQENDESEVKRLVTPDYIMTNVGDDWGVPIANVSVLRAEAVLLALRHSVKQ